MNKIAKFEKVSIEQFSSFFAEDGSKTQEEIQTMYNAITLPTRATTGSAGYDFVTPFDFTIDAGQTIVVPTGIRVKIEDGWFLGAFPKSGLGFKFRAQLDNTVGIIDADYYNSDNEGHILAKITNDSKTKKTLELAQGKAFMQGVFIPFGICVDDNVSTSRNGGFGSTNK